MMNFKQLINQYSKELSLETGNSNYIRHNVYSDEGAKALELYEKAVLIMKERSEVNQGDPLGWTYQASIHGTFINERESLSQWAFENGFVDNREEVMKGNTVLNNCTHWADMWGLNGGSDSPAVVPEDSKDMAVNFLLWHRLYIQSFEDVVRENLLQSGELNSTTWALPYWNYTNPNQDQIPAIFRDKESSLYTQSRSVLINEGIDIADIQMSGNQSALTHIQEGKEAGFIPHSYQVMNSSVENNPHNFMHNLIGGGYDSENMALATSKGQSEINNNSVGRAQVEIAESLNVPKKYLSDISIKPGQSFGLMSNVGAAALDPIFYTHHAFIDKLYSDWNASEQASYIYGSELTNNPWNYEFFVPSERSTAVKSYSKWGDNANKILAEIYYPNYIYDQNRKNFGSPNKALSLLELPAYRPIISETQLNGSQLSPTGEGEKSYAKVLDLGIQISSNDIFNLAEERNPLTLELDLKYQLPMNSQDIITISFGGYNQLESNFNQETIATLPTFTIKPFPMPNGGMDDSGMPSSGEDMSNSMLMSMAAVVDLTTLYENQISEDFKNYLSVYGDQSIGMVIQSNSDEISLKQFDITLNQNLNSINDNGDDFDSAAYLAQNPELLSNQEALDDPEAYFNDNREPNSIAPKLNFRAATTGMRYLMSNTKLVMNGFSSSPYQAMNHYLQMGLAEGLSLGDRQSLLDQSWIPSNNESIDPILDFTSLTQGQTITADVITGRDAVYEPVIGFYKVSDSSGIVDTIDGRQLRPGDKGYSEAALHINNLFNPLQDLNANSGEAESRTVTFNSESGCLAPFASVNGKFFFSYADANEDGISHFIHLGTNLIGFEDNYGGIDEDYDDTLIGFNFGDIQTMI